MRRKQTQPNDQGQTCSSCRWCRRIDIPGTGESSAGECLRYPPAVLVMTDHETEEQGPVSAFPIVDLAADYCGEWKARQ